VIQIRIAGDNPQERGKLFEKAIRSLLERQGYTDIELNRADRGYELDFSATYKRSEIIGECKAYEKRKIGPRDIHIFFSKFTLERRHNKYIKGEFYSLSPLSGGSSGAEAVLNQIKKEDNVPFVVHTPEEIVDQLIKAGLLQKDSNLDSIKDIKEELKSIVDQIGLVTDKKFHVEEDIVLEYFMDEYYWIGLVTEYDKDKKYFLILDSKGEIPKDNKSLGEMLKEQDKLFENMQYLPQKDLNLDSKKLLSVIMRLDKGNRWKSIFQETISILENQHDYTTIASIFGQLGGYDEKKLYEYAEDVGRRIWSSHTVDEVDPQITKGLCEFAKAGYVRLGDDEKVKELSALIDEIDEATKERDELDIEKE